MPVRDRRYPRHIHTMPRGYVEGLVSEIRAAGFENVREGESSFHYLAFLEANRPDPAVS